MDNGHEIDKVIETVPLEAAQFNLESVFVIVVDVCVLWMCICWWANLKCSFTRSSSQWARFICVYIYRIDLCEPFFSAALMLYALFSWLPFAKIDEWVKWWNVWSFFIFLTFSLDEAQGIYDLCETLKNVHRLEFDPEDRWMDRLCGDGDRESERDCHLTHLTHLMRYLRVSQTTQLSLNSIPMSYDIAVSFQRCS